MDGVLPLRPLWTRPTGERSVVWMGGEDRRKEEGGGGRLQAWDFDFEFSVRRFVTFTDRKYCHTDCTVTSPPPPSRDCDLDSDPASFYCSPTEPNRYYPVREVDQLVAAS